MARLEVDPPFLRVRPGESVQMRVRAVGVDRREVSGVRFLWATVDPRAGRVAERGAFTAGEAPGAYPSALQVTALQVAGGETRRVWTQVTVVVEGNAQARPLASVRILPTPVTALQGQVVRLRALGFDDRGVALSGVSFSWGIGNTTLGVMDPSGLLRVTAPPGVYEKAVQVEARYQGKALLERARLQVIEVAPLQDVINAQILSNLVRLEPGGSLDFQVVALGGSVQYVSDVEASWQVAVEGAGSVNASGRLRAGLQPGVYTDAVRVDVTQRTGGQLLTDHAFATVIIVAPKPPAVLASVALTPKGVVLLPGQVFVFAARALDQSGREVAGAQFSWRVVDGAVGALTEQGAFTASQRPGVYPSALEVKVERNGEARFALADITIAGAVVQIQMSLSGVEVQPGQVLALSAVGLDENGVAIPGLLYQWEVGDPRAGTIDRLGHFTAGQIPGVYEGAVEVRVTQRLP
ncbi:MAG: hypothetical protein EXR55_06920 [Dehalococcoidia bacterium]|nr:hypothetical protein [Dehalococcoidia bacterium]